MRFLTIDEGHYQVKMIKDSVSPKGVRLPTMTLRYPRIVHSEFMTHRDRARNSASSRAIPFERALGAITEVPFIPIFWGMERPGMQTGEEIPEYMRNYAMSLWLEGANQAALYANELHNIGKSFAKRYPDRIKPGDEDVKVHKSIPSRMLEAYSWITVVVTATEWNNFWRLRVHKDAEIHIRKMAGMSLDMMKMSTPELVKYDEWHLPFMLPDEECEDPQKVSTARNARVSYETHEGIVDHKKDVTLFERLSTGSGFGHWSPMEHVARPTDSKSYSGPYFSWHQYRKDFPNENLPGCNPEHFDRIN